MNNEIFEPPPSLLKRIIENSLRIPCYGSRNDWIPKSQEDYGEGGAFPECHIPQFPFDMGRSVVSNESLVAASVDSSGKFVYDALVQNNRAEGSIVHSRPADLLGKRYSEKELEKDEEAIKENIERTRKVIEAHLDENNKIKPTSREPQFVRYIPSCLQGTNVTQRLVKIVERPVDPLEPPKFRVEKNNAIIKDPNVPILQAPIKKATKEEREIWNIPPALSNWNNKHGYTIDLDKRLSNQIRGSQEVKISNQFAKLSSALDAAQISARERIEYKKTIQRQKLLQEREKEEQQARQIAELTRHERAGIRAQAQDIETPEEKEQRLARDALREDRKLDRIESERYERMGSKAKQNAKERLRNQENRDISEKIALGQAVPTSQSSIFDPRLMDRHHGLDHGFVNEEDYNPFEKSLLNSGREMALYKSTSTESNIYGRDFSIESLAQGFQQGSDGFSEQSAFKTRAGPVQFERDEKDIISQKNAELERQRILRMEQRKQEIQQKEYNNLDNNNLDNNNNNNNLDNNNNNNGEDKGNDFLNDMFKMMSDAKSTRKREISSSSSLSEKHYGFMNVVAGSATFDNDDRTKRKKYEFISEKNLNS